MWIMCKTLRLRYSHGFPVCYGPAEGGHFFGVSRFFVKPAPMHCAKIPGAGGEKSGAAALLSLYSGGRRW